MKLSFSAELKAHMASDVPTICLCWTIVRRDGVSLFFTEHDVDLEIDGDVYSAPLGMVTTAMREGRDLSIDNMEAFVFLDDGQITAGDIAARLYRNAKVSIFIVNYMDLSMGRGYLCKDWTAGNVDLADDLCKIELRAKTERLNQSIVEVYSASCRAEPFDERCGLDSDNPAYNQNGVVESVTDNQTFVVTGLTATADPPNEEFRYGLLMWTSPSSENEFSGFNGDLSMEIKSYERATGTLVLFDAMPYTVSVGDAFVARFGCDRLWNQAHPELSVCHARFANALNFRGDPWVPKSEGWVLNRRAAETHMMFGD